MMRRCHNGDNLLSISGSSKFLALAPATAALASVSAALLVAASVPRPATTAVPPAVAAPPPPATTRAWACRDEQGLLAQTDDVLPLTTWNVSCSCRCDLCVLNAIEFERMNTCKKIDIHV